MIRCEASQLKYHRQQVVVVRACVCVCVLSQSLVLDSLAASHLLPFSCVLLLAKFLEHLRLDSVVFHFLSLAN